MLIFHFLLCTTEIICETLDDPMNGRIIFYSDGLLFNSVAIITCNSGFTIIGNDRRTCVDPGVWSGQSPQCIGTNKY